MIIKNGKVFIDGSFFNNYDVRIENGIIKEIGKGLEGSDVVDVKGQFVFPGFIDTHIHGAAMVACGEGEEAMRKICAFLPQFGVTSIMPTPIVRDDVERSKKAVRGIRAAKGAKGTDILGIYLYTGFQNRSDPYYPLHVAPTKELTMELVDGDLSDIKMILVAPDLPGALDWIKWVSGEGVIPTIGFTEATSDQIYQAVENGATLTDHFYNGFPIMDHHKSGSTVGCLTAPNLYFQMNCDCIHVAPPFIRLAILAKGIDKIVPVSDSSIYIGAAEGEYTFEDGKKVFVKDGTVRDINGKLVTGAHTFDENVRTMYANGFSLEEIGTMFTENAAKAIRITDRGKIEVGRRGDIVILDEQLFVKKTFILGEEAYSSE